MIELLLNAKAINVQQFILCMLVSIALTVNYFFNIKEKNLRYRTIYLLSGAVVEAFITLYLLNFNVKIIFIIMALFVIISWLVYQIRILIKK